MLVGWPRPAHQHPVGSQACGLAFSIPRGAKRPHSLDCILAELPRDQRIDGPRGATLDSQLANPTLGIGMCSKPVASLRGDRDLVRLLRVLLRELADTGRPYVPLSDLAPAD
jgi:hypothetical protein